MGDLFWNQDGVDRHIHSTCLRDGENRKDLFHGGIEVNPNPVATLHTCTAKSARKRGATVGDFAICQTASAVDNGFFLWVQGRAIAQHMVDQEIHRTLSPVNYIPEVSPSEAAAEVIQLTPAAIPDCAPQILPCTRYSESFPE